MKKRVLKGKKQLLESQKNFKGLKDLELYDTKAKIKKEIEKLFN